MTHAATGAPILSARAVVGGYGGADILHGVDLTVGRHEIVGIVGPNGAGKTTLGRVLSRITRPTEGWAELRGRVGSLLDIGLGFHWELTGRENLQLGAAMLGMPPACRSDAAAESRRYVQFSSLSCLSW